MFEYKLQLGCLIVVLYFTIAYIKKIYDEKVSCSPLFDVMIAVAPWAIVFDGATAWTVNHMDMVPGILNKILHGFFLILMDVVIILVFLFLLNETIGLKGRRRFAVALTPGALSVVGILLSMNRLYYIEGKTTNYSMGIPVIITYASLCIHFLFIFVLICVKFRTIEKRKLFGIFSFMIISLGILVLQILEPEVLISALLPVLAVMGIYINFEDPSFRRLRQYNADMVTGFATLVENRDNNTGGHIRRTKDYVRIILNQMKKEQEYTKFLTRDYIEHVLDAAPMHDIGKIATPDSILQKPGRLTEEEFAIMKQHAAIGGNIIRETFADLDDPEYQQIAYEVARYHHEKWNGRGYPEGLKGEEIPLHARIMAIADVFDAVSAKRCYRDAMPLEKCFHIIEEGAGVDFDPKLVALFLAARDEIGIVGRTAG